MVGHDTLCDILVISTPVLQGVIFNCKSSPNAREFECVNWLPPKPKQVEFGNGNWSIIFENT